MSLFSFLFAAKTVKDVSDSTVEAGEHISRKAGQKTGETFIKVGEELVEKPRTKNQVWRSLIFRSPIFYLFLFITMFAPPVGILALIFFLLITRFVAGRLIIGAEEVRKELKAEAEANRSDEEIAEEIVQRRLEEERIEKQVQKRLEEERQKEQEVK